MFGGEVLVGRGGKVGITLIVIGLVLTGVVVAADRLAVNAAEGRISEEVSQELTARNTTTTGDPVVDIAGFPFLTQVFAGEYDKISISVPGPRLNGVLLDDLTLVAHTVTADTSAVLNGTGSVTASRVVGTASMGWDSVRQILQVASVPGIDPASAKISVANNRFQVRLPAPDYGTTLVGAGRFEVSEGVVRMRVESVTTEGGSLPAAARQYIDQVKHSLNITLNVPDMPYQLAIDAVRAKKSGIEIVATASNVTLAGA